MFEKEPLGAIDNGENIYKFFAESSSTFTGTILNRENIGKTSDELVNM